MNGFLRQHRQMGSSDRRLMRQIVYAYFRTGKLFINHTLVKQLAFSVFLCVDDENEFVIELIKEIKLTGADLIKPLNEKLKIAEEISGIHSTKEIFPAWNSVSNEVKEEQFLNTHFIQPLTWLRIKTGMKDEVEKDFRASSIEFKMDDEINALSIEQGIDIQQTKSFLKGWIEVQDRSSQRLQTIMNPMPDERWWDCCAGAGGKTLLLLDKEPSVKITVTDSRMSILLNLEERLKRHKHKVALIKPLDLTSETLPLHEYFNGIIADVPCTGSGTWNRSPEWLRFFDEKKIDEYAFLQRKIIARVADHVKANGCLIYSTCSVFKKENEENVQMIAESFSFKIESQQYFKGYSQRAETLFAAVLRKVVPVH